MEFIKPLTPYLQKVAIDELGEVPSRIPEDLQTLKLWIKQQPHLKACTDDQFLIQFLRGCKYSLERAKEKLDMFYTLKTKYPELFTAHDVDNKRFQDILNYKSFAILPIPLNVFGPRIMAYRVNFTLGKHGIEDFLNVFNVAHELLLVSDPYACICGIVYILDMGNATPYMASQFTPSLMKRQASFYEKSIPIRIKLVCFLNVSPIVEAVLKVLLSMLSDKLRERIIVCGQNLAPLAKSIPVKYLPQEYGGENGYLDEVSAENNKQWFEFREYFERNKDYGTDETLRRGNPIDFDGLFGMGGSFRRLDVD